MMEVHEDLTEAYFLKFLQSDDTLEKTVSKDLTMKQKVFNIDEQMNPEAMGAFERCFGVGDLANAEKTYPVSLFAVLFYFDFSFVVFILFFIYVFPCFSLFFF